MPHGKIILKRDYSSDWVRNNPILNLGEPGYERDTKRLKIGDGITPWTQLPYFPANKDAAGGTKVIEHVMSKTPHPVYDDGPSLTLLYKNAKV